MNKEYVIKSIFGGYLVSLNAKIGNLETNKEIKKAKVYTHSEAQDQLKQLNKIVPNYEWKIESK